MKPSLCCRRSLTTAPGLWFWSSQVQTYLPVFPAFDLVVEGVPGAAGAVHLSVALQDVGGPQAAGADGAGGQLVPHHGHGLLGGQPGGEVADVGDAVAHGVVPVGVGPYPVPASTLVDVAVRTGDEAAGAQRLFKFHNLVWSEVLKISIWWRINLRSPVTLASTANMSANEVS